MASGTLPSAPLTACSSPGPNSKNVANALAQATESIRDHLAPGWVLPHVRGPERDPQRTPRLLDSIALWFRGLPRKDDTDLQRATPRISVLCVPSRPCKRCRLRGLLQALAAARDSTSHMTWMHTMKQCKTNKKKKEQPANLRDWINLKKKCWTEMCPGNTWAQKKLLLTLEEPDSSYSPFEIHICCQLREESLPSTFSLVEQPP